MVLSIFLLSIKHVWNVYWMLCEAISMLKRQGRNSEGVLTENQKVSFIIQTSHLATQGSQLWGTRLKAGKATQITVTTQTTMMRTEVWQQHTQQTIDLLTCLLNIKGKEMRTIQSILDLMARQWRNLQNRDHENHRLSKESLR